LYLRVVREGVRTNGERASETNNPVVGYQGNWSYGYDVWGNLTHAYRNGQLVYEARYDAFGNRVWAKVGTEERYYLYEGDTLVAELDANGNLIAEYVWGLLGPVARVSGSGVQLYVLDGLGHVRALVGRVGSSWQVTDTYAYDSWGNLIARTGATAQPFTWNGAYGYEYIPATGLYHVGAREYDPRTGRWLQRDPIDAASGDPNLYRYVGNDPVNKADPNGLTWYYDQRTGAIHWDDPSTPPCDFRYMGSGFIGKKGVWRNSYWVRIIYSRRLSIFLRYTWHILRLCSRATHGKLFL